jgi:hypothetical protein
MYGNCTPLEALAQPWHLVRYDIESANAEAEMENTRRKLQPK